MAEADSGSQVETVFLDPTTLGRATNWRKKPIEQPMQFPDVTLSGSTPHQRRIIFMELKLEVGVPINQPSFVRMVRGGARRYRVQAAVVCNDVPRWVEGDVVRHMGISL